jgi:hypothetical protein
MDCSGFLPKANPSFVLSFVQFAFSMPSSTIEPKTAVVAGSCTDYGQLTVVPANNLSQCE